MAPDKMKKLEEQVAATAGGIDGIDAHNSLALELRDKDPERARILAERVIEMAHVQEMSGHSYLRGTTQALITLGELANNSDSYGLALTHLQEAYTLLQGQLFPDLLATASHLIGWAHFRLGNYDEAIDFMNRALYLFEELKNQEKEAAVMTSLGTVYSAKGDHSKAMKYFQKALILQDTQEVNRGKGVTLNNLAYDQIMLEANDEAAVNALAGIQIFRDLKLRSLEARGLDTLGKAFLSKGDLEKAQEILQQGLLLSQEINSEYLEMEAMLNLGKVYLQQGRVDYAREHLLQAKKIAEMRQSNRYLYKYNEMLAKIFEQQGYLKDSLNHLKGFHNAMELSLVEATKYRIENLKIMHKVEKNQKEAEVLWLNNRALEIEIDKRLRERAELEKLATTDPLTGLYNRRHFFTLGEYEFDKARQEETLLTIIMMDINQFKLVNDNYGHSTGDQALKEIAKLLLETVRTGDICFRYGGDEFVILLPKTGIDYGKAVAERIQQKIYAVPIHIAKNEAWITASLGVAQADSLDADLTALIAKADLALYAAKSRGSN